MTFAPPLRCLAVCVIALVALLPGCMDGPQAPPRGDRGAPCDVHEDCGAPLLCMEVAPIVFPVCTGTALEGAACDDTVACAWIRDDRGLPLMCVDALCHFPADQVVR